MQIMRLIYKNPPNDIYSTYDYLELFFKNLILGEQNVLSNRSILVLESQSANKEVSKCQNGSLDCSLDELAVLRFLKEYPDAKQTDIAKHIGQPFFFGGYADFQNLVIEDRFFS